MEVRTRKPKENKAAIGKAKRWRRLTYAGRLRLAVVPGRKGPSLASFVGQNVAKSSVVRTDGWQGYDGLPGLGFKHDPMVVAGDQSRTEKHLPTIHLVFANLKTWIDGTHHGVSQQHLPAYLNEYVFRFNRRFYPMTGVQLRPRPRGPHPVADLRAAVQREARAPDRVTCPVPDSESAARRPPGRLPDRGPAPLKVLARNRIGLLPK